MTLRPGKRCPPLRLLFGAAMALTLSSFGAAADANTNTTAPTAKHHLIVYAGGESPGVEVQQRSDAKHLRGAPKAFKRFIGNKAQRIADRSTCQGGYVGVTVGRIVPTASPSAASTTVAGHAALWAVVDGHWKQIQGTQEIWSCGVLKRHLVPSSVAGTSCYDYLQQKTRHYHQH